MFRHSSLFLLLALKAYAEECVNWRVTLIREENTFWAGRGLSVLDCNHTNVLGEEAFLWIPFDATVKVHQVCVPIRGGYRVNVDKFGLRWSIWNADTNTSVLSGTSPYHNTLNCTSCQDNDQVLTLAMYDSSGDGWAGAAATIKNCNQVALTSPLTLSEGKFVDGVDVCVAKQEGGYVVSVEGGPHPNEFSWTLYSGNVPTVSGQVPFLGSAGCPSVCHDMQLALYHRNNYGWEGGYMRVFDCNHTLLAAATVEYGENGVVDSCVPKRDGYLIEVSTGEIEDRTFESDMSWEILDGATAILAGGAPFRGEINCTTPLSCGENATYHTLDLRSSPTTSWEDWQLSLLSCDLSTVFVTNVTLETADSVASIQLCLPDHGVVVDVGGDVSFPNGVSWELRKGGTTVVLAGAAPFFGSLACSVSPCRNWEVQMQGQSVSLSWFSPEVDVYDCDHNPLVRGLALNEGSTTAVESVCLKERSGYIVSVGGGLFPEDFKWSIAENDVVVLAGGAPFHGDWNCTASCAVGTKRVITMYETEPGAWDGVTLSVYTCNRTLITSNITMSQGESTQTSSHVCVPEEDGVLVVAHGSSQHAHWSLSVNGFPVISGVAPEEVAHNCNYVPCAEGTLRLSLSSFEGGGLAYFGLVDCAGVVLVERIDLTPHHGELVKDQVCAPQSGFSVIVAGEVRSRDSWRLYDGDENVVLSGGSPYYGSYRCEPSVCDGTKLVVVMSDSYGDGWERVKMKLSSCDGHVIEENIALADGYLGVHEICTGSHNGYFVEVNDETNGSEVAWQLLQDSVLVLEGGSGFSGAFGCSEECESGDWELFLFDNFGDGWDRNFLKVESCAGQSIVPEATMAAGFNKTQELCLKRESGYVVTVGGGQWQEEVRWEMRNGAGDVVVGGGSPFYDSVDCSQCENITVGSMEGGTKLVQLHLLEATCDPIPVLPHDTNGATFSVAVRGNILAVTRSDNNNKASGWGFNLVLRCCPARAECGTDEKELLVVMEDSSGDGWNNNQFEITSCNGTPLATDLTLLSGRTSGARVCVPEHNGYKANLHQTGSSVEETSWHLLDSRRLALLSGSGPGVRSFNCFERTLHVTQPIQMIVPFDFSGFAPDITATTLTAANLVYLNSTGCDSFSPFEDDENVVLLVDGGGCLLVEKAVHAMAAKVKLLVVINTANLFVPETTTQPDVTLTTPTIVVSRRVGLSLISTLETAPSRTMGVVFDEERCATVVVGPSKTNTKQAAVAYQSPICSSNRINTDYVDAADVFAVETHENRIVVTRKDSAGGWGMNLMFQCCDSLSKPSVTPSPTSSTTRSATPSGTPSATANATASVPSPTASPSGESAKESHRNRHIPEIVIPTLLVFGIGCGLVFFAHKYKRSKTDTRARAISQSDMRETFLTNKESGGVEMADDSQDYSLA